MIVCELWSLKFVSSELYIKQVVAEYPRIHLPSHRLLEKRCCHTDERSRSPTDVAFRGRSGMLKTKKLLIISYLLLILLSLSARLENPGAAVLDLPRRDTVVLVVTLNVGAA
jgi:hypothetical protein